MVPVFLCGSLAIFMQIRFSCRFVFHADSFFLQILWAAVKDRGDSAVLC